MRAICFLLLFVFTSSCWDPFELTLVNKTRYPLDISIMSDDLRLLVFQYDYQDSIYYTNLEFRGNGNFIMESCKNKDVRYNGIPIVRDKEIGICFYDFEVDTLSASSTVLDDGWMGTIIEKVSNSNKMSFKLPSKKKVRLAFVSESSLSREILTSVDTMTITGKLKGQEFRISINGTQDLFNLVDDPENCRKCRLTISKKTLKKLGG